MSETTRELTCIGCPLGCSITVTMNGTDVVSVTGNTCPRVMPMPERSQQSNTYRDFHCPCGRRNITDGQC